MNCHPVNLGFLWKPRIFIYFELYTSITDVILQSHAKPRGQQRQNLGVIGSLSTWPKRTEFLPTHYSLPRYLLLKRIPMIPGLENVRVSRTYIEIDMMQLVLSHCPWFNACMSLIVGSLFVCIIGLWMSDLKSPQHLAEQTQSFLSYPLNFSKTLTKLRKRFLKKTHKQVHLSMGMQSAATSFKKAMNSPLSLCSPKFLTTSGINDWIISMSSLLFWNRIFRFRRLNFALFHAFFLYQIWGCSF